MHAHKDTPVVDGVVVDGIVGVCACMWGGEGLNAHTHMKILQ